MRALILAGMTLLMLVPAGVAAQTMDDHVYWKLLADELEYVPGPESRPIAFDASFWIGGDYNRVWVKAEGDRATVGSGGELEAQLLYSRLIAPFWELQAGLGLETVSGEGESRTRGLAVIGLEGLAPYWFEVEPQLLVSHEGDIAFALNASYELLFTQRLVLEPELEMNAALQDVPEFGVGAGFSDLSLAARLRYEFVREFAPYVGVVWDRRFGATADLARAAGEDVEDTAFVAGLRVWY
jgi:copper resistance protein B